MSLKESIRPAFLQRCDALVRQDSQAPCFQALVTLAVHDGQHWHYWTADLTRTQAKFGFRDAMPSQSDVAVFLGAEACATLVASGRLPAGADGYYVAGDIALLGRFVERYFRAHSWLNLQRRNAQAPTRVGRKTNVGRVNQESSS